MNEALAFVDSLATRLRAPAETVWRAYVREAPIDASVTLFQCAVLVVLWIVWAKRALPWLLSNFKAARGDSHYSGGEGYIVGVFVTGAALLVVSIIAFISINTVATQLLNPQYWAIQNILGRS